MSNDLVTNLEPRLEIEPLFEHAVDRALLAEPSRRSALDDRPVPDPRPFADVDEARMVVGCCRKLLARHLDPAMLADSVFVVIAAKVLDEVRTDDDLRFAAIVGEPRATASRFDSLVRDAVQRALGETAGGDVGFEIDVPELVAHEVLRQLGPFSIVATAEHPTGPDIVRALFTDAIGAADAGDASRSARAFAEVLRRRALATPARAGGLRAVASAAVGAAAAGSDPSAVVDLRDTAHAGAPDPDHARS